jgi:hypothetical protein
MPDWLSRVTFELSGFILHPEGNIPEQGEDFAVKS